MVTLRQGLRQGLEDSGPVGLGAVPMGMAFGVLVAHSGLAWWWASVFSGLIYAGSLEFLFLGLVLASAPLGTIAVTAFLVNFRHVFYALSFPLHRVRGRLGKVYGTFALSDEAYAVAAGARAASFGGRRILRLQAFVHLYWAGGATAGALLGTVVPARVAGLDFAVTALFTVLALDAFRAPEPGRRDVAGAVLAGVCALAARLVLPGQMLLAAFALFTAALVARRALGRVRL
ncbi:AzlC family ABC transporter permease [Actinomadura sp. NEAU-AAG7]|uniref:AzlC family ABC transporter permease n=1 Tax=Actinomadura sp. NEAU-AAG7 TaxID=2839640 RepID=UPI001BE49BE9|nr:AzlC family ABC transporter permease [Actinomadura sp. NEAU-AAG7]MBT2211912.1 AzlC family ABC transporter permease [Actinomadura sp. NEAU-AAG7]